MDFEWFGAVLFVVIILGTGMGAAASNTSLFGIPGRESRMVSDFLKDSSSNTARSLRFCRVSCHWKPSDLDVIWKLTVFTVTFIAARLERTPLTSQRAVFSHWLYSVYEGVERLTGSWLLSLHDERAPGGGGLLNEGFSSLRRVNLWILN
jgi:hypothetical protein